MPLPTVLGIGKKRQKNEKNAEEFNRLSEERHPRM